MKVQIQVPIWNGNKVGVAEKYLQDGTPLEVTISYKDAKGNLVFPHEYIMSNEKAKTYHLRAKDGRVPPLYIIPIADFEVKQAQGERHFVDLGNGKMKEVVIYR